VVPVLVLEQADGSELSLVQVELQVVLAETQSSSLATQQQVVPTAATSTSMLGSVKVLASAARSHSAVGAEAPRGQVVLPLSNLAMADSVRPTQAVSRASSQVLVALAAVSVVSFV